jgi:hypothetical protein
MFDVAALYRLSGTRMLAYLPDCGTGEADAHFTLLLHRSLGRSPNLHKVCSQLQHQVDNYSIRRMVNTR